MPLSYSVWYFDRYLMIDRAGDKDQEAQNYRLMYPLIWNPMLRREGSIVFDADSGKLISVFVTCADLLHNQEWFRSVYTQLFGTNFWEKCVELVIADDDTPNLTEIKLSEAAYDEVADWWQELFDLAIDVEDEMGADGWLEDTQNQVMTRLREEDPEHFQALTGQSALTQDAS